MEGLGGGAIVAFAAVLWLLYLAPSWRRRRQYLSTERNAVRLQQTLRILAETAEIPDEVRVELSARSVAEQHRALRESARRAETVSRPREEAAERTLRRRGTPPPREPKRRADAVSAVAAQRLRRSRVLSGALMIASVGTGAFGVGRVLQGGTWLPLVAGVVGALGALALLQRAATVAAAHRAVDAVDGTVAVPDARQSFQDWQAASSARPTWTPVPEARPSRREPEREQEGVPLPDRASAEAPERPVPERPDRAAAAAERRATASDRASREPQRDHEGGAAARRERLAALGLQDTEPQLTDLDAVLRRRRAS